MKNLLHRLIFSVLPLAAVLVAGYWIGSGIHRYNVSLTRGLRYTLQPIAPHDGVMSWAKVASANDLKRKILDLQDEPTLVAAALASTCALQLGDPDILLSTSKGFLQAGLADKIESVGVGRLLPIWPKEFKQILTWQSRIKAAATTDDLLIVATEIDRASWLKTSMMDFPLAPWIRNAKQTPKRLPSFASDQPATH